MGMYTEIYVNVDLKEDTPQKILDVLRAMCYEHDSEALNGYPQSWRYLFNDGSYYTPRTSCANFTQDSIDGQWSLLGKGDIKNYESEIETFFAFILPHVDGMTGDFVGYHRYEVNQAPTLVFLP